MPEYLGDFGLGPLDKTGGRTMADTTTLWVTELFEFWINTGDVAMVNEMWPAAKRAIAWLIGAAEQIGLPWHLVCTYDILVLEAYNTTTYNSFLHMLSMAAGRELAKVVGDADTAAAAEAALARAQGAVGALLWNSTANYLRAYTGGDAVMTDALYGQEIALHHGLEWFFDKGKLSQHLAAELAFNGNPFGLTTVTGRHQPPPLAGKHAAARGRALAGAGIDTEDDTIWLQSAPTWSVMSLRLAKAAGARFQPLPAEQVTNALEPTRWQLENYRSRLNDLWNFVRFAARARAPRAAAPPPLRAAPSPAGPTPPLFVQAGLNSGAKWGADSMNGMCVT
jgi:non-lysosomal glucosylceramidase